jgi:hypothetical protein
MATTDRSNSLEKGNVQEMHVEKATGSGELGLTPAGVPHKDDPLVCIITTVLWYFTDRVPALASFVQNLYCRAGFTPWPSWSE